MEELSRGRSRRVFLAGAVGGLLAAGVTGRAEAAAPGPAAPDAAAAAWARVPQIRRRIRPPRFPRRTFPITGHGAVGDGTTKCTDAFGQAIAACAAAGGGRVLVPAGTYLTGAIHLADNVELHLEAGATIKFSRDPADYLPVVYTRYEGIELMNYSPFIYAHDRTNVAITGAGVIDGQADATHWWDWSNDPPPTEGPDKQLLAAMAEQGVPVAERVFGEGHHLRPNLIQLYRCRNVLIEGVTVRDSPMWNIHPVLCTNVTIREVTVDSPRGPNNDGCDPESCVDVLIERCEFNTGDDCVAIKAGKNADGRRVNAPSTNVLVDSCVMRDGNGGVTIGSETTGGVSWVFAWDCTMSSERLERAIRIKTNPERGGHVRDLYFRDITVGQAADAVVEVALNYENKHTGLYFPDVGAIDIRRLRAERAPRAFNLIGNPGNPIRGVRVTNSVFGEMTDTDVITDVTGLELRNVWVNGRRV
ncbi:glycoside hydrolase family 28 protein [Nonomuraea sp. K274]|uniref:Glycoside hydrolase family 28 protein n=1 Tax=Nonomuraea cypriaca TaxID=1187855 RepID=A0A931F6T4_9ACTN|nr:glycoside hydrolase family 28 protein [Nonomuraea cypriaca]MBF8193598.1 glycoside hydrolase family 28 protein [Nonomuraea cypriaca]